MKSDFTRLTFDPARHYTRVLFQQGRPPLDADFNEQTEILLRYLRQAAGDIIGPHGAPIETVDAFAITLLPQVKAILPQVKAKNPVVKDLTNFSIGDGRYYVDGLLCENATPDPADPRSYLKQPYWPRRENLSPLLTDLAENLKNKGDSILVYLDVWEHHRTWLDDGAMRDAALGGADTAARSQIVWQVRTLARTKDASGDTDKLTAAQRKDFDDAVDAAKGKRDLLFLDFLKSVTPSCGSLAVRLTTGRHGVDCGCGSVEAQARVSENQLYRLEVHRAGAALSVTPPAQDADERTREAYKDTLGKAATFKWSRENGCVAARWLKPQDCDGGSQLRVTGPRDRAHGFAAGDWVEILDEAIELRRETGVFVRLAEVQGDLLTIDSGSGVLPAWEDLSQPKVRRWDQMDNNDGYFSDGAIAIRETGSDKKLWLPLENGIQVQFVPADSPTVHAYRSGDFWIFAARAGRGQIEWPTPLADAPEAAREDRPMPPYGIDNHYAPLALVSNVKDGDPLKATDLRRKFSPMAEPM